MRPDDQTCTRSTKRSSAPDRSRPIPQWKLNYQKTRPKVERKVAHMMRRRDGGRRARVRGPTRVGHDFSLLAAAVNLQRLAVLGGSFLCGAWSIQPAVAMRLGVAPTPISAKSGAISPTSHLRARRSISVHGGRHRKPATSPRGPRSGSRSRNLVPLFGTRFLEFAIRPTVLTDLA